MLYQKWFARVTLLAIWQVPLSKHFWYATHQPMVSLRLRSDKWPLIAICPCGVKLHPATAHMYVKKKLNLWDYFEWERRWGGGGVAVESDHNFWPPFVSWASIILWKDFSRRSPRMSLNPGLSQSLSDPADYSLQGLAISAKKLIYTPLSEYCLDGSLNGNLGD